MPSLADLLDPADRQRLEHLADPNPDLADAARTAAAGCLGTQRLAWLCCAVVLAGASSPDEARADLDVMLEDGPVKLTALACLDSLLDGTPATEAP